MNELISVVIPTYNRERTLPRAIGSVLRQTYQEIELIVVDDGSTDQTRSLIESMDDKRIRYVYQPNQGACAARNRGVLEAKGSLIAFQDSDDEWLEDKLARQVEYMRQTQADIVFHAFSREGLEAEPEHVPDECIPSKLVCFDDLVPVNMMGTSTILGKRECFIAEPFSTRYPRFQDWELAIRLVKKYRVYYDASVLARVHVEEDSISKKPELALFAVFGILHDTVGSYREIISGLRNDLRVKEEYIKCLESKLKQHEDRAE